MAHIENMIIQMSTTAYKLVISGRINAGDEEAKAISISQLTNAQDMIEQYVEVREGRDAYAADYLRNEALVAFWVKGLELIKQYENIDEDKVNGSAAKWVVNGLTIIEVQAEKAWRAIVNASSYNSIDSDTKRVLRRKWQVIEELVEVLHRMRGVASTVPDW
jgi:hypothetical protein